MFYYKKKKKGFSYCLKKINKFNLNVLFECIHKLGPYLKIFSADVHSMA